MMVLPMNFLVGRVFGRDLPLANEIDLRLQFPPPQKRHATSRPEAAIRSAMA
jgi:hypothetical protein